MFRVTYVNGRRSIAGSKMTEHEVAIPDLPSSIRLTVWCPCSNR